MTLRERLAASREARFVGREAERALLRAALEAPPGALPFHVLFVYGPGGIGKTALLHAFQRLAEAAGVPAAYLDLRDVAPTPEAFTAAVAGPLGGGPEAVGGDGAAAAPRRRVLLLDTCEAVAPLDGWLRRTFFPEIDEELVVVMAGRAAPDPAWRTDLGWQGAIRLLPLRNLSAEESDALLARQGVPEGARRAALAFTHGYPLALTLVAEQSRQHGGRPFVAAESPDVVRELLQRFLDEVPSPAHREALEGAALVRAVTEPLLAALVGRGDTADLFAWLRGLSFVEEGPRGLFPHDLARDVLVADLRWRDPARHAALHERARRYYTDRLPGVYSEAERHEVLGAYVFLYRDNAVVRPFFEGLRAQWGRAGTRSSGPFRAEEAPVLCAMVARHEGEEAAGIAARWLRLQPEGTEVFRDGDGTPVGFLTTLALEEAAPEDRDADPATAAAWRYLRAHAPLREGERAIVFRFWMDAEAHQGISATQSLAFGRMVRHYLATPHLAFSFLPCAAPEFWEPVLAFADVRRLPEADFTVGGRACGVFGHDWRAVPPTAWLDLLAARVPHEAPTAAPPARPSLLVLSAPDFADAVHAALRDYARPHRLLESPLLRSRLVSDAASAETDEPERVEALRGLIAAATAALEASAREASYARALRVTYLQPAPTQAVAAERLDLPFSTFRRHLKRGVERVTEALWRQETAA
jgi:hypothetical protein